MSKLLILVAAALSSPANMATGSSPHAATMADRSGGHGRVEVAGSPDMQMTPAPIAPDQLVAMVRQTFPEDPDRAAAILSCESSDGLDPRAFDPAAENAGPMQINRWWEPYFLEAYGWSWNDLMFDASINLRAARIVYDDAGGWSPWECFTTGRVR